MRCLWLVASCIGMLAATGLGEQAGKDGYKPIPGLSEEKSRKVHELMDRIPAGTWETGTGAKAPAKRINPEDELARLCTTTELISILACEESEAGIPAFALLYGPVNGKLTRGDVAVLRSWIETARTSRSSATDYFRAQRAVTILARNAARGVPALTDVMRTSKNPYAKVRAAGVVADARSDVGAEARREAQKMLLEALGASDETGDDAAVGLRRLDVWMVEWLLNEFDRVPNDSPLWDRGVGVLARCKVRGHDKEFRALFLKALDNSASKGRMGAVIGLMGEGLVEADIEVYRKVQKDKEPHVRGMLYSWLANSKAPWTTPLLLTGLDDESGQNIEICVRSLADRGCRLAVPKLVALLRNAPMDPDRPFDSPYRAVGEAISTLTDVRFDFQQEIRCAPFSRGEAMVIQNRDDTYRRELARVLSWWKETGCKQDWTAPAKQRRPEDILH